MKYISVFFAMVTAFFASSMSFAADLYDSTTNTDLIDGKTDVTEAGTDMLGIAIIAAVFGWIMSVIV